MALALAVAAALAGEEISSEADECTSPSHGRPQHRAPLETAGAAGAGGRHAILAVATPSRARASCRQSPATAATPAAHLLGSLAGGLKTAGPLTTETIARQCAEMSRALAVGRASASPPHTAKAATAAAGAASCGGAGSGRRLGGGGGGGGAVLVPGPLAALSLSAAALAAAAKARPPSRGLPTPPSGALSWEWPSTLSERRARGQALERLMLLEDHRRLARDLVELVGSS